MQYATLYQEFHALTSARGSLGDTAKETNELLLTVCQNIHKLSEAQLEWGINRNEIRLKDGFVLVPAAEHEGKATSIATLMDKAVLRHEISHHLLGHTNVSSDLRTSISAQIGHLFDSNEYPIAHVREIEADLTAIYLPASKKDQKDLDQLGFEVAFGTLMAQTVLAQLKSSIHLDSLTHPSWRVRHQLSLKALQHFYPSDGCAYAISEVSRFQALLFRVQDRGLGELINNLYQMED